MTGPGRLAAVRVGAGSTLPPPPERRLVAPRIVAGQQRARPESTRCSAVGPAGVAVGMLSAWWAPSGPLISNDEVGRITQAHPDRFVAVSSVDLSRPMDGVRELRRCVGEYGARALRMVPWLWDLPPDDRRYYPLYAACCDLNIAFCTQVGHTSPLCPSESGRPIPYLDRVALEFPELRIVAGHIGAPWTGEMISRTRARHAGHESTTRRSRGR